MHFCHTSFISSRRRLIILNTIQNSQHLKAALIVICDLTSRQSQNSLLSMWSNLNANVLSPYMFVKGIVGHSLCLCIWSLCSHCSRRPEPCGGVAQTLTVFMCMSWAAAAGQFVLSASPPPSRAHDTTTPHFLCQECLFIKVQTKTKVELNQSYQARTAF